MNHPSHDPQPDAPEPAPDVLEDLLRQMSLTSPSGELDTQVRRALQTGGVVGPTATPTTPAASWLTLAATAVSCLLLGLLIGRQWTAGPDEHNQLSVGDQSAAADAGQLPGSGDPAGRESTLAQRRQPEALPPLSGPGRTEIADEQLIVLDGVPVRQVRTVTTRRVHVFDEQRRRFVQLDVPFERVIFTSSPGL